MADPTPLSPTPRSFLADAPATTLPAAAIPAATMNVGLALMSRRSSAIADFWRSCAEVREPTDLMAVQLNYWTQMVDDYKEALSEGLTQIGAPGSERSADAPPPAA